MFSHVNANVRKQEMMFLRILCGFLQLFKANDDRNSEIKHILVDGVLAKYLRFLPITHHNSICMRTEVFGVRLEPGRHLNVSFISSLCYMVLFVVRFCDVRFNARNQVQSKIST